MLRRYNPSVHTSPLMLLLLATRVIDAAHPFHQHSGASTTFNHKKIKSSSNFISEKRANKWRDASPLMQSKSRAEIDRIVKSEKKNIILSLRGDDEEDGDGVGVGGDQDDERRMALQAKIQGISPARAYWADACVVRRSRATRVNNGVAVVGGAENVRRIWHDLGVTPRCIFVPDDAPVPEWCSKSSSTSSTVIVRAPGADINGELLSSQYNLDAVAAEFPLPKRLPRETAFHPPRNPEEKLSRIVVAHGLRLPSNVGSIIRSAYRAGFDAIVLDKCCDFTSEKVLRAAGEAAFDPSFHVFEFGHRLIHGESQHRGGEGEEQQQREGDTMRWADGVSSALMLKRIAAAHRLLPLMMVPQTPYSAQQGHDIHTMAMKFHYANAMQRKRRGGGGGGGGGVGSEETTMGAMVVVGGEASGLNALADDWNRDALHVPMLPVSIAMDNPLVNSINVAAAASIAMHKFRPKAAAEFEEYFRRGIVPEDEAAGDGDEDSEGENLINDAGAVTAVLDEARAASERLLS